MQLTLKEIESPQFTMHSMPRRSVFVITGQKTSLSAPVAAILINIPYVQVPDIVFLRLLEGCVRNQGSLNTYVTSLLSLSRTLITSAPLLSGWTNNSSFVGSYGTNTAAINESLIAAIVKHNTISNYIRDDKSVITNLILATQDLWHIYGPRFSEALRCDERLSISAVVPFNFYVDNSSYPSCYAPIQLLPLLCDNPALPAFYINDCRPYSYYKDCVPNIPLPRLLIRNSIMYQAIDRSDFIIKKNEEILRSSLDLAKSYMSMESIMSLAVHAYCQILSSSIKHNRKVLELIQDNTQALTALTQSSNWTSGDALVAATRQAGIKYRHGDFNLEPQYVSVDSHEFPCLSVPHLDCLSGLEPEWIMDYDEMALVYAYRLQDYQKTGMIYSSCDPNAPFIQSSLDIYLQDWLLARDGTGHKKADDVIAIRTRAKTQTEEPHIFVVPRNGRRFTTFQILELLVLYLNYAKRIKQIALNRGYQQTEAVAAAMNSHRVNLYGVVAAQRNDSDQALDDASNSNYPNDPQEQGHAEGQDDARGASNKDKYKDVAIEEDKTKGKCSICQLVYSNYSEHIRTQLHHSRYEDQLTELGLLGPMIRISRQYQAKASIDAQLTNIALNISRSESRPYRDVAAAINETLCSIGSPVRLDVNDTPRSTSPTCNRENFRSWRSLTLKSRQKAYEQGISTMLKKADDVLPSNLSSSMPPSSSGMNQHDEDPALLTENTLLSVENQELSRGLLSNTQFTQKCELLALAVMSCVTEANRARLHNTLSSLVDEMTYRYKHCVRFPEGSQNADLFQAIMCPFRGIEDIVPDKVLFRRVDEIVKDHLARRGELSLDKISGRKHKRAGSAHALGSLGRTPSITSTNNAVQSIADCTPVPEGYISSYVDSTVDSQAERAARDRQDQIMTSKEMGKPVYLGPSQASAHFSDIDGQPHGITSESFTAKDIPLHSTQTWLPGKTQGNGSQSFAKRALSTGAIAASSVFGTGVSPEGLCNDTMNGQKFYQKKLNTKKNRQRAEQLSAKNRRLTEMKASQTQANDKVSLPLNHTTVGSAGVSGLQLNLHRHSSVKGSVSVEDFSLNECSSHLDDDPARVLTPQTILCDTWSFLTDSEYTMYKDHVCEALCRFYGFYKPSAPQGTSFFSGQPSIGSCFSERGLLNPISTVRASSRLPDTPSAGPNGCNHSAWPTTSECATNTLNDTSAMLISHCNAKLYEPVSAHTHGNPNLSLSRLRRCIADLELEDGPRNNDLDQLTRAEPENGKHNRSTNISLDSDPKPSDMDEFIGLFCRNIPLNQNNTFLDIISTQLPQILSEKLILPAKYIFTSKSKPTNNDMLGLLLEYVFKISTQHMSLRSSKLSSSETNSQDYCTSSIDIPASASLSYDYDDTITVLPEIALIEAILCSYTSDLNELILESVERIANLEESETDPMKSGLSTESTSLMSEYSCEELLSCYDEEVSDLLSIDFANEKSFDDEVMDKLLSTTWNKRLPRSNTIPGPVFLSPEAISIGILDLEFAGATNPLIRSNILQRTVLSKELTDIIDNITCTIIDTRDAHYTLKHKYPPQSSFGDLEDFSNIHADYESSKKNYNIPRHRVEHTDYTTTQLSVTDIPSADIGELYSKNKHLHRPESLFPLIDTMSNLRKLSVVPGNGMNDLSSSYSSEGAPHTWRLGLHNTIILAEDTGGAKYSTFQTLRPSIFRSISAALITNVFGTSRLAETVCQTHETLAGALIAPVSVDTSISPTSAVIIYSSAVAKLREQSNNAEYNRYVRQEFDSRIVSRHIAPPATVDPDMLIRDMAQPADY